MFTRLKVLKYAKPFVGFDKIIKANYLTKSSMRYFCAEPDMEVIKEELEASIEVKDDDGLDNELGEDDQEVTIEFDPSREYTNSEMAALPYTDFIRLKQHIRNRYYLANKKIYKTTIEEDRFNHERHMNTLFQFEDAGVFTSLMSKQLPYEELNTYNKETKNMYQAYNSLFKEENVIKDSKSRIRFIMSKLWFNHLGYVNQENYDNLLDLIKLCLKKHTYNFFNEADISKFLFIPDSKKNLSLLLDSNYVLANKHILERQSAHRIVKMVIENSDNTCYIEYLRMFNIKDRNSNHAPLTSEDQISFQTNVEKNQDANELLAIHTLARQSLNLFSNPTSGIFKIFNTAVTNLFIGTHNNSTAIKDCRNYLVELLFMKLNVTDNQILTAFLLDCFINVDDFVMAQKYLAMNLVLLDKISDTTQDVRPILKFLKDNMPDSKYKNYYESMLPIVLKKSMSLNTQINYNENLKLLSQYKNKDDINIGSTYFDQHIYEKSCVVYYKHKKNIKLDYKNFLNKKAEKSHDEFRKNAISFSPQNDLTLYDELSGIATNKNSKYGKQLSVATAYFEDQKNDVLNDSLAKHTIEQEIGPIDELSLMDLDRLEQQYRMYQILLEYPKDTFKKVMNKDNQRPYYRVQRGFCTINKPEDNSQDSTEPQIEKPKIDPLNFDLDEFDKIEDPVFHQENDFLGSKVNIRDDVDYLEDEPEISVLKDSYTYNWVVELKNAESNEKLLDGVKNHFTNITADTDVEIINKKQIALISLINLSAEAYNPELADGYLAFHKIFHQGNEGDRIREEDLFLSFETCLGRVEKNYHKYLPVTMFKFDLGENCYMKQLDYQSKFYKRMEFKRIVAHFCQFSNKAAPNYQSVINLIVDICDKQKVILTLLEFYNLAIFNGFKFSSSEFGTIIGVVSKYKYYNEDVLNLAKTYSLNANTYLRVDLIEEYIEMLIKNNKSDALMFCLDRMKETIDKQKYIMDSNLSSQDNSKLEQEHKDNLVVLTKNLYKNFLNKLVGTTMLNEANLVYTEIFKRGWIESSKDYINGLNIYSCIPESFEEILTQVINARNESKIQVSLENVVQILNIIQTNSRYLGKFTLPIVENFFAGNDQSEKKKSKKKSEEKTKELEKPQQVAAVALMFEDKTIKLFATICFKTRDYNTLKRLLEIMYIQRTIVSFSNKRYLYRVINKNDNEEDRKSVLEVATKLFDMEDEFLLQKEAEEETKKELKQSSDGSVPKEIMSAIKPKDFNSHTGKDFEKNDEQRTQFKQKKRRDKSEKINLYKKIDYGQSVDENEVKFNKQKQSGDLEKIRFDTSFEKMRKKSKFKSIGIAQSPFARNKEVLHKNRGLQQMHQTLGEDGKDNAHNISNNMFDNES